MICVFISILFLYPNERTIEFLKIYPGAKAVAMGGAFASIGEDVTALYYNPGSVAFFQRGELGLHYSHWTAYYSTDCWAETTYGFIGIIKPIFSHVIGMQMIYFSSYPQLVIYLEDGSDPSKISNFAIGISYAKKITHNLGIGGTLKIIYGHYPAGWLEKKLYPDMKENTWGFAFDTGILYKFVIPKNLRIGISLLHLGPKINSLTPPPSTISLPYTLKAGVSYKIPFMQLHSLQMAAEITKVMVHFFEDWREKGTKYLWITTWKSIGIEYAFRESIFLRGGYFEDREQKRIGYTFGGGIYIKPILLDIATDSYIYPFDTENWRISLTYRF